MKMTMLLSSSLSFSLFVRRKLTGLDLELQEKKLMDDVRYLDGLNVEERKDDAEPLHILNNGNFY